MTPSPRCLLRPSCYEAAWEGQHRPHPTFAPTWSFYEPCNRGGDCADCQAAHPKRARPFAPGVIREDHDGRPWLMNRRDRGWGELGYRYNTWGDLLAAWDIVLGRRDADEHGNYFTFELLEVTRG